MTFVETCENAFRILLFMSPSPARDLREINREIKPCVALHLSSLPFFWDELRLRHDIDISSRKSEGSETNNRRVYQTTGVGYHVSRLSRIVTDKSVFCLGYDGSATRLRDFVIAVERN